MVETGYIYIKSGNTNLAKITVNQEVLEEKYFYWDDGSDSATTTDVTINSGVTATSATFTTNYNTTALTTTVSDSWVIGVTIESNSIVVNCMANDTYVQRIATIKVKKGNSELATLTLTQKEKETQRYFYWGNTGNVTTTAITVNSAETSINITYRTNYDTLTTANTGTWNITSAVLNNGTMTISFPVNDAITDRVASISIKSVNTVVATINITQLAKAYFLWSNNNSSSITQTIADTTTATSLSYTTNMSGLVVSADSVYNWVTNKTISNPNGNGTYDISVQTNTTISARIANLFVKSGVTEVGKILLEQRGEEVPEPIYRDVLDTAIGGYVWSLNEERDAIGIILHQVSYDNGSTWETESQEDVSDDVKWSINDTSILQEISFHRFKAVGYGNTNGYAYYKSEFKSHSWQVE